MWNKIYLYENLFLRLILKIEEMIMNIVLFCLPNFMISNLMLYFLEIIFRYY